MPRGKHGNHARGAAQHRWNDGRMVATTGYAKLRVGRGHPLADRNGFAYEHLVVWVAAGYQRPDPNQVLHHRNGNRLDNRIENLEVLSRAQHNREHLRTRRRDPKTGRLLDGREWNEFPEVVP